MLGIIADNWIWVAAAQLTATCTWVYWRKERLRDELAEVTVGVALSCGAFLLQLLLTGANEMAWAVNLCAGYLFVIICWWSWILKPNGSDVSLTGPLFGSSRTPTTEQSSSTPAGMPDLNLLNKWRKNGNAPKAYQEARKAMLESREALPIWLFVAEMAATHYSNLQEAERIIRQLCRSNAFEMHEKALAIESLKTWAAAEGYQLDLVQFSEGENGLERTPALTQASRLRVMRKPAEAVKVLKEALQRDPADLPALLLLARMYALEMESPDEAELLLESAISQFQLPSAFVDFARRSLADWREKLNRKPKSPARSFSWSFTLPGFKRQPIQLQAPGPKARLTGLNGTLLAMDPSPTADLPPLPRLEPLPRFDALARPPQPKPETQAISQGISQGAKDLLKTGYIGTAIEQMEKELASCPDDYNACLQLAEIYCHSTDNIRAAEVIIRRIQSNPAFNEEQKAVAQARLRDWTTECLRRRCPETA